MQAFLRWILILLLLPLGLRADDAAVAAEAAPATRPLLSSTVGLLGDYALSPSRLRWGQIHLASAVVLVGLGLHQSDVWLAQQVSTGDARKPWLDQLMPKVSNAGEGWVEASVVALGWGLGGQRLSDTSAQALQALAIAGVYAQALKYAAWSNRPSQDMTQHRYFAYDQGSMGMPSGHSFSAFALAEVYGAEYGRWVSYPFAILIAYSRLYNQAHWSSDVYAGAVLGIAAGWQVRQAALTQGQPRWKLSLTVLDQGQGLQLSRAF